MRSLPYARQGLETRLYCYLFQLNNYYTVAHILHLKLAKSIFYIPYLSSDHLALLVHPLHGGGGEEGEDETEGADEVPREGVDQRKLFKDHLGAMEAGKKNHWHVEGGLRVGRDVGEDGGWREWEDEGVGEGCL